ncbi:cyclopropane fatty acyl phospholipid synthase [Corynebacterium capitovis DSM 44611]|nr:cyclopropane fatty acyl phospholipid synthase [Corynebacterium capitovis DSM 44611]
MSFARACSSAGLEVGEGEGADLTVERAELFPRLAVSGWVGLAESYMAAEWATPSTQSLVDAIVALISAGYRPRATPRWSLSSCEHARPSGDIPPDLVQHYAGDGTSSFAGHFATGVATSERVKFRSHTPGAGRRGEPAAYFVDVTNYSDPVGPERGDLGDAQRRSAEMLLDACGAGPGTHLIEYPSSGGTLAVLAAHRRGTVDSLTTDPAMARSLAEHLVYEGVDDAVRVELGGSHGGRVGSYDAVVAAEKLETLSDKSKEAYLRSIGRLVRPGGRVALQTIVQTPSYTKAADAAVDSLRAYVWPALSYCAVEDIGQIVDRATPLRMVACTHAPGHLAESLRLQRELFDAHLREAAADGYDPVYRRLWRWQFAVREALARMGMLDVVQITFTARRRAGSR